MNTQHGKLPQPNGAAAPVNKKNFAEKTRCCKIVIQRFAVISDLHSNLEAVTAVLEDIENQDIKEIYCLGDVVGYGPNPNEVLKFSEKFMFSVIGNHDEAVLHAKTKGFNPVAAEAILWTRNEIFYPTVSEEMSARNRQYLQSMKKIVKKETFLFAHGSARSNMEYVMSHYDALHTFKYMAQNKIRVCFIGHTHWPGIFLEGNLRMIPYDEKGFHDIEKSKKMIVNVGSVGQPRDKNHKACYLIVDGNRFYYRRVQYDVDKIIKKIYGINGLNDYLGDRLRVKGSKHGLKIFH